jgi:hypothetical protein
MRSTSPLAFLETFGANCVGARAVLSYASINTRIEEQFHFIFMRSTSPLAFLETFGANCVGARAVLSYASKAFSFFAINTLESTENKQSEHTIVAGMYCLCVL